MAAKGGGVGKHAALLCKNNRPEELGEGSALVSEKLPGREKEESTRHRQNTYVGTGPNYQSMVHAHFYYTSKRDSILIVGFSTMEYIPLGGMPCPITASVLA